MYFDHFNISAPLDLLTIEKDFWCDILNFNAGFRPAFNHNGFWLYANGTDKAIIHLSESNIHAPSDNKQCLDHVAFKDNDINSIIAKLTSRHIPFKQKHIEELNMIQIFFTSPAGIGIEINGENA
ncbi:hypothetical protein [Thalassotalea profundi]|uniref:Diguanylate cyclase n=1 Tax=Thalassotalea profundi TaxID=2036687 RepID=A0ABQ3J695_9GAMM|nr:hypothetical protein [Thalassotalea profundi]GHF01835.1 diguanylate cyclase [Thalassotalea profundi]